MDSPRVAHLANRPARIFAPILSRCSLDFISFRRLAKTASRENCPRENWFAKLVNFANAAGRKGKSGAMAGSGGKSANSRSRKLRVHADAKVSRGDLVIVFETFPQPDPACRRPKRYYTTVYFGSLPLHASQRSRSNSGKLRPPFPKRSYRSTI